MFKMCSQVSRQLFTSSVPRFFSTERPYIVRLMNRVNEKGENELIAKITSRYNDRNHMSQLEKELKKDFLEVYRAEDQTGDQLIVVQNKNSFLHKLGKAADQVLSKTENTVCDPVSSSHTL